MRYGITDISVLFLAMALTACGGNQSAVEGRLVDWNGKPVAGAKLVATQVQPLKGYEELEALTGSDGSFRIRGLFPSSRYVLRPWSEKWNSEVSITADSPPKGETAILQQPIVIEQAFLKSSGALVTDLASGKTRMLLSPEGVITDMQTSLEWVAGPDQDTNYAQAEQWVAKCDVAGGGWRMPTRKELATLYQRGVGKRNIDPIFKTSGRWVWAEPNNSSQAWTFNFGGHQANSLFRYVATSNRVFAVRSGTQ